MVKITTDMNTDSAQRLFDWATAVADTVLDTSGDAGQSYKVRLGDLTPVGVHYLAGYGGRESVRDSVSGVRKAVKEAAALCTATTKSDSKPWFKWVKESGVP